MIETVKARVQSMRILLYLLEMGATLDLTRFERVRFIVIPAALP